MFRKTSIATTLLMLIIGFSGTAVHADASDVQSMLTDWVVDFRSDPTAAAPVTFGIRVKDATPSDWHVVVAGKQTSDSLWSVELVEGFPEAPCAFFITDTTHLRKVYSGELASLTAMGKAFSTDFAPLDIDAEEGFEPGPGDIDHLIRLSFHFWTRGFPEVVKFGDLARTRPLHGANATLFYYQEGFRSGWFSITKGQHVNADENSRTNPFHTLFIMTRGKAMARIGGVEKEVSQGDAMYIGPGVSHEFWNDTDEPAEGVLVMFGEGA
jgi:mannose-6-phosphate isomerase-like protein (cupin superfamily)